MLTVNVFVSLQLYYCEQRKKVVPLLMENVQIPSWLELMLHSNTYTVGVILWIYTFTYYIILCWFETTFFVLSLDVKWCSFYLSVCWQGGLSGPSAHTFTEVVRSQSKTESECRTGRSKDIVCSKIIYMRLIWCVFELYIHVPF